MGSGRARLPCGQAVQPSGRGLAEPEKKAWMEGAVKSTETPSDLWEHRVSRRFVGVMLGSCLVLACSASSFSYRHGH